MHGAEGFQHCHTIQERRVAHWPLIVERSLIHLNQRVQNRADETIGSCCRGPLDQMSSLVLGVGLASPDYLCRYPR